MRHFVCFYPPSQTPPVTCCSYTGSKASTSRRTGSGPVMEHVQCSSLQLCPTQRGKNACVTEHLPCGCHLLSASPEEPGLSCTLPAPRAVWTYRPLPFCADAPSPPALLPSAVPSLFCRTNKTSSATPANQHHPSSPPPTQLRARRLGRCTLPPAQESHILSGTQKSQ